MKKHMIKRLMGLAAFAMAIIIVSLAVLDSSSEVLAKSTLPGVERIISQNSETNKFSVLEIVPEQSMGEIGYYIGGSEPANWTEQLSRLTTKDARIDYVNSLYDSTSKTGLLSSITSTERDTDTTATAPLYFSNYEEKYFLSEADQANIDEWKVIDFSGLETPIVQDLKGTYNLVEAGQYGDYTKIVSGAVFEKKEAGNYIENVDYYKYLQVGGNWDLKFQYNDSGHYVVDRLSVIADVAAADNLPDSTFLYKKVDGIYIFAGTKAELKDSTDGSIYYTIKFRYNETPTGGAYDIMEKIFNYGGLGEYTSVLNSEFPYLEVKAGTGNYVISNPDSITTTYKYTAGTGNCNWTGDDQMPAMKVEIGKIYYKGGFENQEWFRKYVLDLEPDSYHKFYFDVKTVTPQELETLISKGEYSISDADMIFISGTNKAFLPADTADAYYHRNADGTSVNDVTWSTAQQIFSIAVTEDLPVILDYSIIQMAKDSPDTDRTGANLYKLATMLVQDNLETYYNNHFSGGITAEPSSWTDIMEASDSDQNFVNENVYVHAGSNLVNNNFSDFFADDKTAGFEAVIAELKNENFYRKNDTAQIYEPLDERVSEAVAVKYIINYANRRVVLDKQAIRILEIEPCASYDLTKDNIMDKLNLNAYNLDAADIELVQMTTAEFVGRIEDLNSVYDMIYIGMNAGLMNRDANNETVYNDSDMNGLVYSNIGDKVYCIPSIAGMLNTDYVNNDRGNYLYSLSDYTNGAEIIKPYKILNIKDNFLLATSYLNANASRTNVQTLAKEYADNYLSNQYFTSPVKVNDPGTYRYSGNDITEENYLELKEFLNSGYPVVFADQFFKKNSESADVVNEKFVDQYSHMYRFANDMAVAPNTKKSNVFKLTMNPDTQKGQVFRLNSADYTDSTEAFRKYLNMPKLDFNLVIEGDNRDSDGDGIGDGKYYLHPENGEYMMSYDFEIQNDAAGSQVSSTYECNLYVDVNADGKYSKQSEEVYDIQITRNGTVIAPVTTVVNGVTSTVYQLNAGVQYHLERMVTEDYVGVLPWKVEITQSGNPSVRNNVIGYSVVAPEDASQKEDVNILQIDTAGSTLQLDTNSLFNSLIQQVEGFRIKVTRVSVTEFEKQFKDGNTDYLTEMKADGSEGFNMLILGFGDMYQEIDNTYGAMTAILDFVESGRSVLFTHDTTSFINVEKARFTTQNASGTAIKIGENNYWGYNINTIIRNVVGMDRYGVTLKNETGDLLKQGIQYQEGSDAFSKILSSGKDVAFDTDSTPEATAVRTTSREVQGYTYPVLNDKGTFAPDVSLTYNIKNTCYSLNGIKTTGGQYDNMSVTQVNSGQITNYPFVLKPSFKVARTHSQYYQLDLEADDDKDGESDIVVWYCLGGTAKTGENMYSISPNDVRNNYYIYNKGNITYSGVGHSQITNADEMKLFINTMIASYKAGFKAPKVNIIESGNPDLASVENVYIPADVDSGNVEQYTASDGKGTLMGKETRDANGNLVSADTASVYFYVKDTNFVKGNKIISAKYYVKDDTGTSAKTIDVDGEDVHVIEIKDAFTYEGHMDGTDMDLQATQSNLSSGGAYEMRFPVSHLGDQNTVKLYVEVTSTIQYYNTTNIVTSVAQVNVNRLQLFDLE
ncbi:DUF5057 domain-containing protein [Anaerobium acetethylicum]|uniref:Uncharacterized protein n=1 Tax=Anaerobium acetethylicum TaxID=1619234 RepID=A0A1D3TN69_9FIRM|nr:DUF5057 domain-containing protein [Anaerobium acetethylicum]SCP94737.1 protein of unknown function [Anaerobium acetethylicum]